MNKMNKLFTTLLVSASVIALGACEPQLVDQQFQKTEGLYSGYADTTSARLNTVAKQALEDNSPYEAVKQFERVYKIDSGNPRAALNYASALRLTGNPERASVVLAPFVEIARDNEKVMVDASSPDILLEYAAIQMSLGRYSEAEDLLHALASDTRAPELRPQALNLIGVTLDARGRHDEAEPYYEQAMDLWQGEPVSVMNNLALNLAHQGYFDESLNLLRQALVIEPDSEKIAANIDFVRGLQASVNANRYIPTKP